jgi:hypothetical protein
VLDADQMAAGGDRRGDPRLGLVIGHPDVDVDPIALRARRVHFLEPELWSAAVRVDQVLVGAVAAELVAEHGAPERENLGNDQRVDRDLHGLDGRGVGGGAQLACPPLVTTSFTGRDASLSDPGARTIVASDHKGQPIRS